MSNYINKKTMILSGVVIFLLLIVIVLFNQEVIEFDPTTKKIKKVVKVQQPSTTPKPKTTTPVTTPPVTIPPVTTPPVTTPPITTPPATTPPITTPPITTPPVTTPPITSSAGGGYSGPSSPQIPEKCIIEYETFCKDSYNLITECQPRTNRKNDEYAQMLRTCIGSDRINTDKTNYNKARELLVSRDPVYDDDTNVKFIPRFLVDDCSNLTDLNIFCKTPYQYLMSCKKMTEYGIYTFISNMRKCLKNNLNIIDKNEYELFKKEINKLEPLSKDPKSNLYLPPFPSIVCKENSESSSIQYFCKNAGTVVENCGGILNEDYSKTEEKYIKDLNYCIKNLYTTTDKIQYNKARGILSSTNQDVLNKKSVYFVPMYPEVPCEDTQNFARHIYDYVNTCDYITIPEKVKLMRDIISNQTMYELINKDDYEKARVYLIELIKTEISEQASREVDNPLNILYYIPIYPGINCKSTETSPLYTCKNLYSYVKNCSTLLNLQPLKIIDSVKTCLITNELKQEVSKEDYEKAYNYLLTLDEINTKKTLPSSIPSVICNTDTSSLFCRNPLNFINECSTLQATKNNFTLDVQQRNYKQQLINMCLKDIANLNMEQYNEIRRTLFNDLPEINNPYTAEQCEVNEYLVTDLERAVKTCYITSDIKINELIYKVSDLLKNYTYKVKVIENMDKYIKAKIWLKENKDKIGYGWTDEMIDNFLPSNLENVDCSRTDPVAICDKPDAYIKGCPLISLDKIADCASIYQGYTNKDRYKIAQDYAVENGKSLPDISSVKCDMDNVNRLFCTNPDEYVKCSKVFTSGENYTLPFVEGGINFVEQMKNCVMTFQSTDKDKYNRAKTYIESKGYTVPNFPTMDCNINTDNPNGDNCLKVEDYMKECIGIYDRNGSQITLDKAKKFIDKCDPNTNVTMSVIKDQILPKYESAKQLYQDEINKQCTFSDWKSSECNNGFRTLTRTVSPDNLGCGPLSKISNEGCPSIFDNINQITLSQEGTNVKDVFVILFSDKNYSGTQTLLKINDKIQFGVSYNVNVGFTCNYGSMIVRPGVQIIFTDGSRTSETITLNHNVQDLNNWLNATILHRFVFINISRTNTQLQVVGTSLTYSSQQVVSVVGSTKNFGGVLTPLYVNEPVYIGTGNIKNSNELYLSYLANNSLYSNSSYNFTIYQYSTNAFTRTNQLDINFTTVNNISSIYPFGYYPFTRYPVSHYVLVLTDTNIPVIQIPVALTESLCLLNDILYTGDNIQKCKDIDANLCLNQRYYYENIRECQKSRACSEDNDFFIQNIDFCKNAGVKPCDKLSFYSILYPDDCPEQACKTSSTIDGSKSQLDTIFNTIAKCINWNTNPDEKTRNECLTVSNKYNDIKDKLNNPNNAYTNYKFNNPDTCRQYNIEPCSDTTYMLNNKSYCESYAKSTVCKDINFASSNPLLCGDCNNTQYLSENITKCKIQGFEPCNNFSYAINNISSCRDSGNDPCKFEDYLQSHPEECRKYGFEPCNNNIYKQGHIFECRKAFKNKDPCNDPAYLATWTDECKLYGFEPCDSYIMHDSSIDNSCITKFPEKYDNCKNSSKYIKNNSILCRTQGVEACEYNDFLNNNLEECLKVNPSKYDKCKLHSDYVKNNSVLCRTRGVEACQYSDFLNNNLEECRKVDPSKYEPCYINNDYKKNNYTECKNLGYDACDIPDNYYQYSAENPELCKTKINEICNGDLTDNVKKMFITDQRDLCRIYANKEPCKIPELNLSNYGYATECSYANDICEYPAFRDKYPDFCKRNCEYINTGTCLSNSTTPTTGKGDTKTTIKITIPKRGNGTCNVTDGQIVSTVSNSCNMPCTYDQWSFIGNNNYYTDNCEVDVNGIFSRLFQGTYLSGGPNCNPTTTKTEPCNIIRTVQDNTNNIGRRKTNPASSPTQAGQSEKYINFNGYFWYKTPNMTEPVQLYSLLSGTGGWCKVLLYSAIQGQIATVNNLNKSIPMLAIFISYTIPNSSTEQMSFAFYRNQLLFNTGTVYQAINNMGTSTMKLSLTQTDFSLTSTPALSGIYNRIGSLSSPPATSNWSFPNLIPWAVTKNNGTPVLLPNGTKIDIYAAWW